MRAKVEKVSHGDGESFVVKERRESKGFGFLWHFHPEYELTLVLRSAGRRFVGDHMDTYGDGDLVLLGENLPHTWASEEKALSQGRQGNARRRGRHGAVVVQFSRDALGAGCWERPELMHIGKLLKTAARGIQFTGQTRQMATEQLMRLTTATGVARMILLLEILDKLARSSERVVLASAGYRPVLDEDGNRRIDAVCTFINGHFQEETLRLADAAAAAYLSVSAFSRFFLRTMNKTFTAYVNELRVGHACTLLLNSDESVAQIALASGFGNLSHFNRRFLKVKEVSPREYRKLFGAGR